MRPPLVSPAALQLAALPACSLPPSTATEATPRPAPRSILSYLEAAELFGRLFSVAPPREPVVALPYAHIPSLEELRAERLRVEAVIGAPYEPLVFELADLREPEKREAMALSAVLFGEVVFELPEAANTDGLCAKEVDDANARIARVIWEGGVR